MCVSYGSCCWDKTPWPKLLKGKGFTWLILPQHCSSKEIKTGTQTGQHPGDRSWHRGHGGVFLTGFLSMACSTYFLIEPKTMSSSMASPIMGCLEKVKKQKQNKTIYPGHLTFSLFVSLSLSLYVCEHKWLLQPTFTTTPQNLEGNEFFSNDHTNLSSVRIYNELWKT